MKSKGGILAFFFLLSLLLPPFPSLSFSSFAEETPELAPQIIRALRAQRQPFLLTLEDVIKLKERGISDDLILMMLQRAERERSRFAGVTRVIRRGDGQEIIVYGAPSEPPWPEVGYYYVGPDGKVFLFSEPPEGEERRAWDFLKSLHLEIQVWEERP